MKAIRFHEFGGPKVEPFCGREADTERSEVEAGGPQAKS